MKGVCIQSLIGEIRSYMLQESGNVSRSVVSDSTTLWTVACQAPLSMEFSRQEHWSGLPFPSPRDLLNPGIKPGSSALQLDVLPSGPPGNARGTECGFLPNLQLRWILGWMVLKTSFLGSSGCQQQRRTDCLLDLTPSCCSSIFFQNV